MSILDVTSKEKMKQNSRDNSEQCKGKTVCQMQYVRHNSIFMFLMFNPPRVKVIQIENW